MKIEFVVRDLFRLSTGTTVLACEGRSDVEVAAGSHATLVAGDEVRQELSIVAERRMLKQSLPPMHRALEINEPVTLSVEEARSGAWRLVVEN